jgi:psiF repeat
MRLLCSVAFAAALPLLLAGPAAAVTAKQKMETCKFGADDQKLTGAKRQAFISRCMANRNDPRGSTATPKTAAKPAAAKPAGTDVIMAPEPKGDGDNNDKE